VLTKSLGIILIQEVAGKKRRNWKEAGGGVMTESC